jgi:ubiquitin-protein ligase
MNKYDVEIQMNIYFIKNKMKFKNILIVIMSFVNKRLLKELRLLTIQQNSKNLLDNDYLVSFDESDLTKVFAIIKAPKDSVYRHKFIRLNFDIPNNYPFSPPVVTFVNYDGVRINPTLYEDSRTCCTILNTWPGKNEGWSSSMGVETVILTFLSFLDNNPYMLEPGERDDSTYTTYVLHQTWYTCLIRYLENKNTQPKLFTTFISNYLLLNINNIMTDLYKLNDEYPPDAYETKCFYIGYFTINYDIIINKLSEWYNYIDYKDNYELHTDIDYNTFINTDYSCNICFDTQEVENNSIIKLNCNHEFHTRCIEMHIKNNGNICSLCRTDITEKILDNIKLSKPLKEHLLNWIINPESKRRVKIGSRTYFRLIAEGIIDN